MDWFKTCRKLNHIYEHKLADGGDSNVFSPNTEYEQLQLSEQIIMNEWKNFVTTHATTEYHRSNYIWTILIFIYVRNIDRMLLRKGFGIFWLYSGQDHGLHMHSFFKWIYRSFLPEIFFIQKIQINCFDFDDILNLIYPLFF